MSIDLKKIIGTVTIPSCHKNHSAKSDLLYTLELAYAILEELDILDIKTDNGWHIGASLATEINILVKTEVQDEHNS